MKKIVFVTGNQNKADYLSKLIGINLDHQKIILDEIQSLDLQEVVEHKVLQAYEKIHKPVIVEDVSLEFSSFGRLPGTFIKFWIDEIGLERLAKMLDGLDRSAVAKCVFGFYDGKELKFFESYLRGQISVKPLGSNGFGFDKIFIPEGYEITRGQMNDEDNNKTYKLIKPIDEVEKFLKKYLPNQ
jgi:non-canonical purine NTP pyrophosphatase (RdgB/HAM1 family)